MINPLCRPLTHLMLPGLGRQALSTSRTPLRSKVNTLAERSFSKPSREKKIFKKQCYAYINPPQETSIPKMALGGAIWGFSFAGGKYAFDSLANRLETYHSAGRNP